MYKHMFLNSSESPCLPSACEQVDNQGKNLNRNAADIHLTHQNTPSTALWVLTLVYSSSAAEQISSHDNTAK